jgi:hypothetical protein
MYSQIPAGSQSDALPPMIQGDGRSLSFVVERRLSDPNDWQDSEIEFVLGVTENRLRIRRLLTLTRAAGQILVAPAPNKLTVGINIPGSATAGLEMTRGGRSLHFDFTVIPPGGQPYTKQGTFRVMPRVSMVSADAPIGEPFGTTIMTREPSFQTVAGTGVVDSAQSVTIANTGSLPATVLGQLLPAGTSASWSVIGGRDKLDAIAYDATGTTLLIFAVY